MKILVTQSSRKASTSHKLLLEKTMFVIISFLLITGFAYAQKGITVKGRLTDQTGEGIPNASVVIKGTSKGVRTNNDGSYVIEVPDNATLLFTSVDFISRELAVGGRSM